MHRQTIRNRIPAFCCLLLLLLTASLPLQTFAAGTDRTVRWQDYNGKKIGVLVGPLMEDAAKQYFPDSEHLLFDAYPDCVTALESGKIDAFLGDEPGMKSLHNEQPAVDYIHDNITENNYSFAFRKNDPQSAALCKEFNAFLKKSWKDGTMEELDEIWFGTDEKRKTVDLSGLSGEKGTLRFEFYVTPFDYASPEGPARSAESRLYAGKKIGLCWAVIDYDGGRGNNGFWNLSKHHRMFGNASMERLFTLMPLEARFRRPVEAAWDHYVVPDTRRVVFTDKSYGNVTSWKWDFGDGTTSTERNPVHEYREDGTHYVVTLYVSGPEGEDRCCKIWDVCVHDPLHPAGTYD